MLSTSPQGNYMLDDRLYRYETFPYMDPAIPLISPITNAKLYPPSTRNYFNIDLLHEGNYSIPVTMPGYNIFRANPFNNYVSTPTGLEKINFQSQYTPNKEISMQNKILINEDEGKIENKLERNETPSFKTAPIAEKAAEVKKVEEFNEEVVPKEENTEKKKLKRPSLDLNLVNDSETGKIFTASMVNSYMNKSIPTNNNILNINEPLIPATADVPTEIKEEKPLTQEEESSGTSFSDKSSNLDNRGTPSANRIKMVKLEGKNLAISPKSAFMKMK
jgi:hypothetical protein